MVIFIGAIETRTFLSAAARHRALKHRLENIERKIAKVEEEIVETQVVNLFGTVPVSYNLQQLNLLSGVKG